MRKMLMLLVLLVVLAVMAIAATSSATVALSGGTSGVHLACAPSSGGGCGH
jgi:hypothetical protein